MKTLVTTLAISAFAMVSVTAVGQTAPDKGAAAYQNPAAEKTQTQKSKEGAAEAAKSSAMPRTKSTYDDKSAQAIVGSAGSDAAAAKANVDASKKTTRQKPKNVKDMTPEERAAWQKQLKEQSKP